jgi:hypothetical protein
VAAVCLHRLSGDVGANGAGDAVEEVLLGDGFQSLVDCELVAEGALAKREELVGGLVVFVSVGGVAGRLAVVDGFLDPLGDVSVIYWLFREKKGF